MLKSIMDTLPRPEKQEPRHEFASAMEAGEAIKAAEKVDAARQGIKDELQQKFDAYVAAEKDLDETRQRLHVENQNLDAIAGKSDRARGFILRNSPPSDEENQLQERAVELQKKVGELKLRYKVHAVGMKPPKDTQEFQRLAEVNKEVKSLEQRRERRDGRESKPGPRLIEAYEEQHRLQGAVNRYRQNYEHWQEIDALKREAQACTDKRQQLQQAREEAAIVEAVKTK